MAPKKENRKMVDMLERMGMIKKMDGDPDLVASDTPETEKGAPVAGAGPALVSSPRPKSTRSKPSSPIRALSVSALPDKDDGPSPIVDDVRQGRDADLASAVDVYTEDAPRPPRSDTEDAPPLSREPAAFSDTQSALSSQTPLREQSAPAPQTHPGEPISDAFSAPVQTPAFVPAQEPVSASVQTPAFVPAQDPVSASVQTPAFVPAQDPVLAPVQDPVYPQPPLTQSVASAPWRPPAPITAPATWKPPAPTQRRSETAPTASPAIKTTPPTVAYPTFGASYIAPDANRGLYPQMRVAPTHRPLSASFAPPYAAPAPVSATAPTAAPLPAEGYWMDTPSVDSTVDRFLDVSELYSNFRMKLGGTETIYLIEDYIKTLPDSLPPELRRSIIIRILESSGFDYERLVSDGIERVSKLNEYAGQFAKRTEDIVTRQNAAIEELQQRIDAIRSEINDRKNLHKRQFLAIEDEAQRLKDILDFVTK